MYRFAVRHVGGLMSVWRIVEVLRRVVIFTGLAEEIPAMGDWQRFGERPACNVSFFYRMEQVEVALWLGV